MKWFLLSCERACVLYALWSLACNRLALLTFGLWPACDLAVLSRQRNLSLRARDLAVLRDSGTRASALVTFVLVLVCKRCLSLWALLS